MSYAGCREVYHGLLRCSAVIAFEKFNRQFHTGYVTKENEDWFNIHGEEVDAWKVKEQIDNPSQICRYCDTVKVEEFDWDYAGADVRIEDYVK